MKRALLYFVKYPEPGKAKTRLAKSVGFEEAARMYRDVAESNFRQLRGSGAWRLWVIFDPPERERDIELWLDGADQYCPQKDGDLGERLSGAFEMAFQQGFKQVIALGSDTLSLEPKIISRAFEGLDQYDVVLGPARDGGYYLIGLTQPQPVLFRDIPWSSSDVLSKTRRRIEEAQLSYYLLTELEDLDEEKQKVPGSF